MHECKLLFLMYHIVFFLNDSIFFRAYTITNEITIYSVKGVLNIMYDTKKIFQSVVSVFLNTSSNVACGEGEHYLTTRDIAEHLSVTIYKARYLLMKLESEGLITQAQQKKHLRWKLVNR